MKTRTWIMIAGLSAVAAVAAEQGAAQGVVLKSGNLAVTMDASFPRVIACQLPAGDLAGNPNPVSAVVLNGKPAACKVTSGRKSAETLIYQLTFPAEGVALKLTVTVAPTGLTLQAGELKEQGGLKLRTLAFPDNPLLTISTAQPDAALAACHATNTNEQFKATFRERIAAVAGLKVGEHDTGNYLFLSAGKVAGGIASSNFTDIQRTAWQISERDGVKACAASVPVWEFRMFDDETPAMPRVSVFVTPDLNGDDRADWQDAALVYRRVMPKPLGSDKIKDIVGENVAMNFASGAQQPFLRILDNIKRFYLATDGLGSQVIIKGCSSEGHDSANSDYADHWNERAGGLTDLNCLLGRAGQYNTKVGIHINASEAYPEAKRYRPEILHKKADGSHVNGWSWLDQAHMLDKVQDVRSGQLFAALERMRTALPDLGFVYVDTYWENGWPAAQTARKINSLGLPMYSEGDCCLDPWIVWGHWRSSNHTIQRFLWYSDRDLFSNDPILRGGRADADGYMGWQNRYNLHTAVGRTISQRLPGKFLQHFELLRWQPGQAAEFSDGVKVAKTGDEVAVSQHGRVLMTWTGGGEKPELLVPWPPQRPEKCYVWSDAGGERTLELPPSWQATGTVWIYQLDASGRTRETAVAVNDKRIVAKVEKGVPYVIYPRKAPAQQALNWGEGGPVKNPGFDSPDLAGWTVQGGCNVEADGNGNQRLMMAAGDASVSQALSGLQPGQTYAATVWALTKGKRRAALEVTAAGTVASNYVDLCNVKHSAPNDPRTGSNYQRLRVLFSAAPGTNTLTLHGGAGEGSVEFDDVRVVVTALSPEAERHYLWEDFEHVESGGYGPFTCCPGERTHLSESNPPYTNDTIRGRFSLKSRDGGCVLRTLPSSLRLKPATKYRLSCATIGNGHLTAVSQGSTVMTLVFANKPNFEPSTVSGEFVTRKDSESYLALFRDGGDFIAIDDLAIDEVGDASEAEMAGAAQEKRLPDEHPAGLKLLQEEKFVHALGPAWQLQPSTLPGTSIDVRDGALTINGYANTTIHADLTRLPAGTAAVQVMLGIDGDAGQTWGPGMGLVWPGGQQLWVNLRAKDGKLAVDSTASAPVIAGKLKGDAAILRIRWDDKAVVAEAISADNPSWQKLAELPRDKFPGTPSTLRLGKTHGVEALDDHSDIGNIGTTRYTELRIYGK